MFTYRALTILALAPLFPALAMAGAGDQDLDEDGFTEQEGDCDDSNADSWPGAVEACWDGRDQDCNGDADDACMYLAYTTIELGRDAGLNSYSVSYPSDADESIAFMAVRGYSEDGPGHCDYTTTMTDLGSAYSFDVLVENCGSRASGYGFVAEAVVLARRGGPGGFSSFDLTSLPTLTNHRDQGSTSISYSDETQAVEFCSMYTVDGQGDVDVSWHCTASESSGLLSGEIYENHCDNKKCYNESRHISLGLGNNLEVDPQPFTCKRGGTTTVTHTISEALGTDHAALVFPQTYRTGEDDHLNLDASCSLSGSTYTCSLHCFGTGRYISGQILFIDGSFQ